MYYEETRNRYLYATTDFITWFTAVRSFTLYELDQGERAWALLLSAVENMSSLTGLMLGSNLLSYDLDLPRVIDVLGDFGSASLENLQTLGLKGVSTHGDSVCQTKLKVCMFRSIGVHRSIDRLTINGTGKRGNSSLYQASVRLLSPYPQSPWHWSGGPEA